LGSGLVRREFPTLSEKGEESSGPAHLSLHGILGEQILLASPNYNVGKMEGNTAPSSKRAEESPAVADPPLTTGVDVVHATSPQHDTGEASSLVEVNCIPTKQTIETTVAPWFVTILNPDIRYIIYGIVARQPHTYRILQKEPIHRQPSPLTALWNTCHILRNEVERFVLMNGSWLKRTGRSSIWLYSSEYTIFSLDFAERSKNTRDYRHVYSPTVVHNDWNYWCSRWANFWMSGSFGYISTLYLQLEFPKYPHLSSYYMPRDLLQGIASVVHLEDITLCFRKRRFWWDDLANSHKHYARCGDYFFPQCIMKSLGKEFLDSTGIFDRVRNCTCWGGKLPRVCLEWIDGEEATLMTLPRLVWSYYADEQEWTHHFGIFWPLCDQDFVCRQHRAPCQKDYYLFH